MSRRKKKQNNQQPVLEDPFVVPKEVTDMDDNVSISKPLLVKIITDMIRGERERYKKMALTVAELVANQSIQRDQIRLLQKRSIEMTSLGADRLRGTVTDLEEELKEMSDRIGETENIVCELVDGYNNIDDYVKHREYQKVSGYDGIEPAEDEDDRDTPQDDDYPENDSPLISCYDCCYTVDGFDTDNKTAESLFGRCLNRTSYWYGDLTSSTRRCSLFKKRWTVPPPHQITGHTYINGAKYYDYDRRTTFEELHRTRTPKVLGYDLVTEECEEILCQKA